MKAFIAIGVLTILCMTVALPRAERYVTLDQTNSEMSICRCQSVWFIPYGEKESMDSYGEKVETGDYSLGIEIQLPSGYSPSCTLKTKDAISAINRAVSDSCKRQIAEIACKSVDAPGGKGNLYPTQLPKKIPTATTLESELVGKYLGTFTEL